MTRCNPPSCSHLCLHMDNCVCARSRRPSVLKTAVRCSLNVRLGCNLCAWHCCGPISPCHARRTHIDPSKVLPCAYGLLRMFEKTICVRRSFGGNAPLLCGWACYLCSICADGPLGRLVMRALRTQPGVWAFMACLRPSCCWRCRLVWRCVLVIRARHLVPLEWSALSRGRLLVVLAYKPQLRAQLLSCATEFHGTSRA